MQIKRWMAIWVALVFLIPFGGQALSQADLKSGLDGIRPAEAYETCRELASPRFAGRLTGDEGYSEMSRWVAQQFASWGLTPLPGAPHFLQAFRTQYTLVDEAEMSLSLPAAGKEQAQDSTLKPASDFLPLLYSDSADQAGQVVFAGWGISAPALGYDDYADVDPRGRFVLCFRGTPDPSDDRFTNFDQHRTRMKTAAERGALGILYIYDEPLANPNGDWLPKFASAIVSGPVADLLLKERGVDRETLRSDLLKYKRPISFRLGASVRLKVVSRHFPDVAGYNVCGVLEGSDPQLKHEFVVIGAHADHCGRHLGLLFPGANDNASGSAAVIEIARAFSKLGLKPRRSLLFVLFGGEETGLQGSEHFARNLEQVPGRVVGMINFDMVGAGDRANCGFSSGFQYLEETVREADKQVGILRSSHAIRRVGVRSSDFAPFFVKGIPCLSFSSNGPHLAYHQDGDTIFRINPDMLAGAARLGFASAYLLANRQ